MITSPMTKDTRINLRVDVKDLKRWQDAAKAEGRSLANWITHLCNTAAPAPAAAKTKTGGKS